MLVLLCVHDMENQGIKLAISEQESYRGRVNNLSQTSHALGLMWQKFNDAHKAAFRASCIEYLKMLTNYLLVVSWPGSQIKREKI